MPEPTPEKESVVLTDAEREQRCRREQISHEHYAREDVERIVAARVAEAGNAALRRLAERVEAAYPADTFPRSWVLGEDRRSGTVRTFLDMIYDARERTTPPDLEVNACGSTHAASCSVPDATGVCELSSHGSGVDS